MKNVFHRLLPLSAAAFAGCMLMAGCNSHSGQASAPIITNGQAQTAQGQDPALANMANSQPTQVLGASASYQPQQSSESYPEGQQAPAPIVNGAGAPPPPDANGQQDDYSYNQVSPDQGYDDSYDQGQDQGQAPPPPDQGDLYSTQAPPELPEYDQPEVPGDNYIWTPGYWAWGPMGYYWVPGAWVVAPYYGALWTPPYWGWYGNRYWFHHGYWGPHIGFYGGINYGYGYIGYGYWGGYWRGNSFYYNRSVNRIGGGFRNAYDRPVVYNNVHYGMRPNNRISFNGGRGGINVRPRAAEMTAMREPHVRPTSMQQQAHREAANNRGQLYSANKGRPAQFAANKGYGSASSIRATPGNVRPGRPGMNGNTNVSRGNQTNNGSAGRPGMNNNRQTTINNAGQSNNRMAVPGNATRPGNTNNRPNTQVPANNNRQTFENRNNGNNTSHVQPQQHTNPGMQQQNRPQQMQQQREARPQVQQQREVQRPQQQVQRAAPQRPAQQMQQRAAPQRQAPQAHEAPRPAPQQHEERR